MRTQENIFIAKVRKVFESKPVFPFQTFAPFAVESLCIPTQERGNEKK
ncbi:hypothetical protein MNBD_GAMMA25-1702 [hydrothermal vent metagenome]|uniref:Uncharacterized protein n=1 Tax=hydrothermal vent metagenome TaxID=652676 RepID=A0A3B1AYT3_9ZZZZ